MSLLGIGTSALLTSQGGLRTTSHNISNVNTQGYSRQRIDQVSPDADYKGGQYYGSGVYISSVERLYDDFLASQTRFYTSQEAQQRGFYGYARQVDDILGTDSVNLSVGLNEFFAAVNEVADDPTLISARQQLISRGVSLATRFNTLDSRLTQLDSQVDFDIKTAVEEINTISQGIAELNLEIFASSGGDPNDLLDKRDKLIDDLSEYVSTTVIKQSNGMINIQVGSGQTLVIGTSHQSLTTFNDLSGPVPRLGIAYGVNNIDITAHITGGSIGGALDFRTGIIDKTRTDLDLLAESLVEGFNAVHNNASNVNGAFDLDGNAGGDFFDPANITASTISVMISDPRLIAASSGTNIGPGNNENALALADLQKDTSLVTVSATVTRSLGEHYSVVVSDVALRTQRAQANQQTQEALLQKTRRQLDSVSGVNLDEEAADLIKYQQAYQAASQIIVASNTVFDSLISAV